MKQIYNNKDIGEAIDKSFDAGIKEGYRMCREEMMKEAVDHFRDATKMMETTVSADLEEAAEEHASVHPLCNGRPAKNSFIAGAKWQSEQDQETIELAEDHAYLAGAVNEREKMVKDAVEGEVFIANADYKEAIISVVVENTKLDYLETGDKVRVIVLPKEDEK